MKIKLKDLFQHGKRNNYPKEVRLMAKKIMRRYRDSKIKTPVTYQELLPDIDFRISPNRSLVGRGLGLIWDFCNENGIPPINLLIIRKDTLLPGAGVVSWYKNTFGTTKGYEGYCALAISVSSYVLSNELVTIEQESEEE